MSLLVVGLGILLLLILILVFKLNAFISLIIVSLIVAVLEGLSLQDALLAVSRGIGGTLGSIILIMVFGAMLGKLLEESGAAERITYGLISMVGVRNIQWAVLIAGFLIGFPMIYNAGFLVLIPIVFSLAKTIKVPLLSLGIPMAASLSTAHGLLPPHPAPTAIAALFKADINATLLYGLIIALPTVMIAGPLFSGLFKNWDNRPGADLFAERTFVRERLPGLRISILIAIIPVMLMLLSGIADIFLVNTNGLVSLFHFVGDPTIALLIAVLTGIYFLGIKTGKSMDSLMQSMSSAVGSVSMILLIIASGGAFKQVLLDSGVGEEIKSVMMGWTLSPILLSWLMAAIFRLALGSATVAAITTAGIIQPLVSVSGVQPELMVLSVTAGSLMFSHLNDVGYWMFKEYFNLSIRQTFATWTVMEAIVSFMGLLGALMIDRFS